jgi:hypothetical protein
VLLACGSRNTRTPRPSKKAIPQPSPWISVSPPRAWKPAKEKQMSVGVLQFIPKSWHMILILIFRMAAGACGHVAKTLASTVVKPHNLGLRCVF